MREQNIQREAEVKGHSQTLPEDGAEAKATPNADVEGHGWNTRGGAKPHEFGAKPEDDEPEVEGHGAILKAPKKTEQGIW